MKKTKIKLWTGSIWEEVFPETDARVVHFGNNGTNLEQWHQTTDSAIQVLFSETNNAVSTAQQALQLAAGASGSTVFLDYEDMYNSFKYDFPPNLTVGQHVLIIKLNVPDLWISKVDSEFKFVEYTTDEDFLNELAEKGSVHLGIYHVSALETQKVNLPDYVKFTDYATASKAGVIKVNQWGFHGLSTIDNGQIAISGASNTDIDNATSVFKPIVANNYKYAVKKGITTNTETFTDEEKAAACETIGALKTETAVSGQPWVYIKNRNGTQNTMNLVSEWDDASSGVPMYFVDKDENGNLVYMQLSVNPIPTRRDSATSKEFVENNFVAKETATNKIVCYGKFMADDYQFNVAEGATSNTLCYRGSDGVVGVGTPKEPHHATNRGYVDDNFVAKPTDTSGFNRIVGVNTNNTAITYKVQYPNYNYGEASAASRVGVPYMEQGQIACAVPTADYSAANKKYVDENSTKIYRHNITVTPVSCGPNDKLLSLTITSTQSEAYTTINESLLDDSIEVRVSIQMNRGDSDSLICNNTIRGYTYYGIELHGVSSVTQASIGYASITVLEDNVTKL